MRALDHDPEQPRAFLFTVAANLARDEARSAVRRRRHLELIKTEAAGQAPQDPAVRLEAREQAHAVRAALARLGERDRDVLLLWDAGLDYQEIAAETGLSANAVGTTLARARRRLVEAYEGLEGHHVARG